MGNLLNRARMTTATTGTGTVTLGSAVPGYFTFGEAGAADATVYSYTIEDGNDFEIGEGTYTASGTAFSRDTVTASKISGTAGTSKINLSGTAEIFITARAEDTLAADNSITNAKLRDSAALSVIGRSSNSSGDPADIAAGADGYVLRRAGTSVAFGQVDTGGITNDAVTNDKLANMAVSTFKGRVSSGSGDPEDLTAAQAAAIVSAGKPAFSAHKNGTNQTGIASATGTKVTFSTELFDVGGYFDTSTSRFTPPAGKYILVGNLLPTAGVVDQQVGWALIYKNGSQIYSTRNGQSGTAAQTTAITVCVDANGTDYFELYYRGDGAGDKTLFGGETETYFIGWQL